MLHQTNSLTKQIFNCSKQVECLSHQWSTCLCVHLNLLKQLWTFMLWQNKTIESTRFFK